MDSAKSVIKFLLQHLKCFLVSASATFVRADKAEYTLLWPVKASINPFFIGSSTGVIESYV